MDVNRGGSSTSVGTGAGVGRTSVGGTAASSPPPKTIFRTARASETINMITKLTAAVVLTFSILLGCVAIPPARPRCRLFPATVSGSFLFSIDCGCCFDLRLAVVDEPMRRDRTGKACALDRICLVFLLSSIALISTSEHCHSSAANVFYLPQRNMYVHHRVSTLFVVAWIRTIHKLRTECQPLPAVGD
jgi:hypothetical protein